MLGARLAVVMALAGVASGTGGAAWAGKPAPFYTFLGGADGANPYAGLVAQGGRLYGTTSHGGGTGCDGAGCGSVFAVDAGSGAEQVLYSFSGGADGAVPYGSLLLHGHVLYGTSSAGGASGNGTVFSLDPKSGAETVLYSFAGGTDAAFPASALIYHGGAFYGTTRSGGAGGFGTVFKVDAASGAETVVYSFAGGADGANPQGGVIYQGKAIYGTTTVGGASDGGTIYKVDIKSGAETVLYAFLGGSAGANPYAALMSQGGLMYGTTLYGGSSGSGTVFSIDPSSGAYALVHDFRGYADGAAPYGGVIYNGGLLYGTTYFGGPSGTGIVFSLDPASDTETTLFQFRGGKEGSNPFAGVIYQNGTLYGTTQYGGKGSFGTVFKVSP